MDFDGCLDYLDHLGNEVLTMKLGLENIRRLLQRLGNPHHDFPAVLIAGTNGKGSTARFLASILEHSGYRTGLYTSPHLVTVRERIAVEGVPISKADFSTSFSTVVDAIPALRQRHHPTYFETLTATAFHYFSECRIQVGILEVGLGGRLDSTNVVEPLLSVITPIGRDHTQVLGETIEEIAAEKGGIIHSGRPVVAAPQTPAAEKVLREIARTRRAPLFQLSLSDITGLKPESGCYRFRSHNLDFELRQAGRHQVENAALALSAAEQLKTAGFALSCESFPPAVSAVRPYSSLRLLDRAPELYVDGGHNPAAAERLADYLQEHTKAPRTLVLGMMRDKEIGTVASILSPLFERIYLTRINYPRAASLEELKAWVPEGVPVPDWREALTLARRDANTVLVGGSLYLVGEVVEEWAGPIDCFWDPPRSTTRS